MLDGTSVEVDYYVNDKFIFSDEYILGNTNSFASWITKEYIVNTNIGDIMQEPKTRSSIRVINVPEIIMLILAEHRSSISSTKVMVVSQTNSEQPLSPRNFSRTFSEWCAAAGLTTRRVHDLRHTYASQLMSLNVQ